MTYLIRIEETSDYKWLLGLLDRANEKQRTDPNRFDTKIADHIANVSKAIQAATKITITSTSNTETTFDSNQPTRRKPKKKLQEKVSLPNLCPEHKTYGAKYTPRNACESCWKVYEKYTDPAIFKQNKARFERKHGKLSF